MTHQQRESVENSLANLSKVEKWELVERLVRDLRSADDLESPVGSEQPATITKDDFKRQLVRSGLMLSLPTPTNSVSRPELPPISISGEPLSATIIRERR